MNVSRSLWRATFVLVVGALPAAAAGTTTYALPVSGITVDGNLEDWPTGLPEVPVANTGAIYGRQPDLLTEDLLSSADLSATFRVGYDAQQDLIYVAVRVRDDALVTGKGWTETDASEVYLGGAGPVHQYSMVPGAGHYAAGGENPAVMGVEWARTRARGAWRRTGDVTVYEWAVEAFGRPGSPVDLQPGLHLPFDVAVADRDATDDPPAWVTWGPYVVQKFGDPARVGTLVLLEAGASLASLKGTVTLTGHTVQARDGDRIVGSAPVRGDGSFEMHVPSGQYQLAIEEETMKVGARPVVARTGETATATAALYRVQPPEPGGVQPGDTAGQPENSGQDFTLYEQRRRLDSILETVTWLTLFTGVFTFLIWRQVLVSRTRQLAIQSGQPLPGPRPIDLRKVALILIALGVAFGLAIGTTLALEPSGDAPHPLAVAVWGLIPVLLGGALWIYHGMVGREQR